jgi:hypothetical protein
LDRLVFKQCKSSNNLYKSIAFTLFPYWNIPKVILTCLCEERLIYYGAVAPILQKYSAKENSLLIDAKNYLAHEGAKTLDLLEFFLRDAVATFIWRSPTQIKT